MNIADKRGMYELYATGGFGNRPHHWGSVDEYVNSDFAGLVGIRNRLASSPFCDCRPHTRAAVIEQLMNWRRDGLDWSTVVINETAPHWIQTINAEVMRTTDGIYVRWSPVQKVMREALAELSYHWTGLRALLLLQQRCDAPSYDNLVDLLDRYPEHIVELSAFTRSVGIWNWNTIFWEVRLY
jgi:hypothetical protein